MIRIVVATFLFFISLAPALAGYPWSSGDALSAADLNLAISGGEPVTQNLLGPWTATASSITTGTSVPWGSGATLTEDGATSDHSIFQQPVLQNMNYTVSVTWKHVGAATRNVSVFVGDSTFANGAFALFLSSTCTINGGAAIASGTFTVVAAHAESLGGNWCQGYITAAPGAAYASGHVDINLYSGTSTSYAGDGASGVQLYPAAGAMLKLGNHHP